MKRTLWVVTELYFPEQTSTGHVMTTIAEGLSKDFDVAVVCAQPTYSERGLRAETKEQRNGVAIRRVRSTTMNNRNLFGRLVNLATVTVSVAATLCFRVRSNDTILVVTNPPTLPYVVVLVARLRRAKTILAVHDLFPESAEVQSASWLNRFWGPIRASSRWLYRSFHALIAIGPDQAERIEGKIPAESHHRVSVVPLAADFGPDAAIGRDESRFLNRHIPLEHRQKLLVQFAGNIGPLQGTEFLLDAIRQERLPEVHFAIVGDGRARPKVEAEISSGRLSNVTLVDSLPRAQTADLHAGCDVVVVSLAAGMKGISVPSRIGNALASGRPVLAISDEGSTIDRLVKDFDIGWSIRPGDVEGFWHSLSQAHNSPGLLSSKGLAAQHLARQQYKQDSMIQSYADILGTLAHIGD